MSDQYQKNDSIKRLLEIGNGNNIVDRNAFEHWKTTTNEQRMTGHHSIVTPTNHIYLCK